MVHLQSLHFWLKKCFVVIVSIFGKKKKYYKCVYVEIQRKLEQDVWNIPKYIEERICQVSVICDTNNVFPF